MQTDENTMPLAVVDPARLDVYRAALDFQSVAGTLVRGRYAGDLRDQLARASLSIVLNIAEGAGRVSPADKARFFAIARGSAYECSAVLDVLERDFRQPVDCRKGRALLVRVAQMLTRLIASLRRF